MTEKLYYKDSYLESFESKVIKCKIYEEGYVIVLEKTAFYPEGGGQPSDQGTLNGIEVKHVFIKEDIIYHVTDQQIPEGIVVKGKIDFKRRWDYMQQHSGEHIVSGIIKERYGYSNVGFHLGEVYMTADFEGEFSKQEIIEIENLANKVVFNNVPIESVIYDQRTMKDKVYRSKIEILGEIRLVTVQGCDICACCGMHVAKTGEIGLIKILSSERHRGGMRMSIVCGVRALKDYQARVSSSTELSGLLSVKQEGIVEGVKKLQQEVGEYKQLLAQRIQEVLEYRAREYTKNLEGIICIQEEGLKTDEMRKLCVLMSIKTSAICAVFVKDGEQIKYALGAQNRDVRNLCNNLNQAFNGKGGGKKICQGSLKGEYEEIVRFLKEQE